MIPLVIHNELMRLNAHPTFPVASVIEVQISFSYYFACNIFLSLIITKDQFMLSYWQVLGESMAGISHNAKNSNLPEFGDSVSAGSKALCGLTEAAAQVTITGGYFNTALIWDHLKI